MLADRLLEERQTSVAQQLIFVLHLLIVQQIVFKAAKMHAVTAKNIASFQAVTQLAVDQKLIAIGDQLRFGVLGVEIAF